MSIKSSFWLFAAAVFLSSCSAPLYLSNTPGLQFTIVNPITQAALKSNATRGTRFLTDAANQTIRVTVSGSGIASPIIAMAVPSGGGTYTATLTVPLGHGRTVLVEAFDATGSVYASVSSTLDLENGMAPITLKLQPDSKSTVEFSPDLNGFSLVPGKVSIYKRTVTMDAFSNSAYFFGVSISMDDNYFLGPNDFIAMIDASGNEILSPRPLRPNPDITNYFFDGNTKILPYAGTFYLIVWGESDLKGFINNFPAVVQG